jgi:UDP-galactopyranose mutase
MSQRWKRSNVDLVCFSHLRWDFVYQRPQHLMSRFARHRRVFFFEEPVRSDRRAPGVRIRLSKDTHVRIVTPLLPAELGSSDSRQALWHLANKLFGKYKIVDHISWFYTPMAIEYRPATLPSVTVYDCMDELSLFMNAPTNLLRNEQELFKSCDLVFTGGISLFEAKCQQHSHVYPFPSSVDAAHFLQARALPDCAPDQMGLSKPRLGYVGVIDERIDLRLIHGMAEQRPEWQFVMVGPVVKIDPAELPRLPNIHWLGPKDYKELPKYMAGWNVALMPFALNESTRYISPTKTPEYLAAGLPVVSTAVRDVVRQYGNLRLVKIATGVQEFLAAAEEALTCGISLKMRHRIDQHLQALSWDQTWSSMDGLIQNVISAKRGARKDASSLASRSAPLKTMTAPQGKGKHV